MLRSASSSLKLSKKLALPSKQLLLVKKQARCYATESENVFMIDGIEDYNKRVVEQSATTPVLVDCYADWCGPCRILAPVLAEIASDPKNNVKLAKVDVENDENNGIASQLKVSGIPAVFLYKNGKIVGNFVGAMPKPQILAFLEHHTKV